MRAPSSRLILAAAATVLFTQIAAHAGREVIEEESPAEAPAWMLGDWGGLRSKLEDRGVNLWLDYTGEILGNPIGGRTRATAHEGALDLGLELELERLVGWRGATICVSGNYSYGPAYAERRIGDLTGVTTLESYDTARLLELWFQQEVVLGPARLSLRVGSQALDAEFWLNDHQALLVNNTFGTPSVASGNFPIPSYALAALGARFSAVIGKPSDRAVLFQFGAFDGNPASGVLRDPSPRSPRSEDFNKHGTDWALRSSEGALLIAEAGFTFNQLDEDAEEDEGSGDEEKEVKEIARPARGLAGTYRLGMIHHTDRFSDVHDATLSDAGIPLRDGRPRTVHGNTALYVTVDQEIWREPGSENEGLSVFGRAAFAARRQSRIDASWEAGLHYLGLLPGRPLDQLALGFGFTQVNSRVADATREADRALSRRSAPEAERNLRRAERDLAAVDRDPDDPQGTQQAIDEAIDDVGIARVDLREAQQEDRLNRASRSGIPDYEAVVELTYRAQLTPWFALQPDVQWVIHPGATGTLDDALVLGLRAQVSF
jgi:porin